MKQNVFITGISGCVGHYVYEMLASSPDYELYLLVRDAARLTIDVSGKDNVHIIYDSFSNIESHTSLLKEMDYVIHILTAWSGPSVELINIDKTLYMFNKLDQDRLKKIIYFSTASILGPDNKPDPNALKYGTGYIETKYQAYLAIKQLPFSDRIYTIFPTLVMGGGETHPYSHITSGINIVEKYLWLLKWFSLDMRFNYIHSYDIALVVKYLMENEVEGRDFILGNMAVSSDDMINALCEKACVKRNFKLNVTALFQKLIPKIMKLHPWSKYCIERKDFLYDCVCPETIGIDSPYKCLKKSLEY